MAHAARDFSEQLVEEVADGVVSASEQEGFGGDVRELTEVMSTMVDTVGTARPGPPPRPRLLRKVNSVSPRLSIPLPHPPPPHPVRLLLTLSFLAGCHGRWEQRPPV